MYVISETGLEEIHDIEKSIQQNFKYEISLFQPHDGIWTVLQYIR